jgi:DNA topoisomerase III
LLQRHILGPLTVDGSVAVLLYLTDNGALTEVPVPTGGPRGPAKTRTSRRRAPRQPTGSASESVPRRRKGTRRRNDSGTQEPEAALDKVSSESAPRPREQPDGFVPVAMGTCPLCGADVVEQPKSYVCNGWKQGCRFTIWKTIAGKAIGVRTAQSLLKKGQSPLLKGFRSKAGRRFDARLKLEGGEVRFDFPGNDRPRRPPIAPDSA